MTRRTTVKLTPLRRHLAAVLTLALSCAFVAVMVVAGNLMQESLRSEAAQQFDGADLEITRELTDDDWASEQPLAAPEVAGAEAVWPLLNHYLPLEGEGTSAFLQATMDPPAQSSAEHLLEGVPAAEDTEIVLDENATSTLEVSL